MDSQFLYLDEFALIFVPVLCPGRASRHDFTCKVTLIQVVCSQNQQTPSSFDWVYISSKLDVGTRWR